MFAIGTDGFVMAGVLPELARSFQVSIGAAGQVTTAYALSYALLAPTVAALAGDVPRKRLMLSGLVIFVAANLATVRPCRRSIRIGGGKSRENSLRRSEPDAERPLTIQPVVLHLSIPVTSAARWKHLDSPAPK